MGQQLTRSTLVDSSFVETGRIKLRGEEKRIVGRALPYAQVPPSQYFASKLPGINILQEGVALTRALSIF